MEVRFISGVGQGDVVCVYAEDVETVYYVINAMGWIFVPELLRALRRGF